MEGEGQKAGAQEPAVTKPKTTTAPPEECTADGFGAAATTTAAAVTEPPTTRNGWYQTVDATSGRVYYVNPILGRIQWELPVDATTPAWHPHHPSPSLPYWRGPVPYWPHAQPPNHQPPTTVTTAAASAADDATGTATAPTTTAQQEAKTDFFAEKLSDGTFRISEKRILDQIGDQNHSKKARKSSSSSPRKRPSEINFEQRIEELKQYKQEHGDCNVIRKTDPTPNYRLHEWVKRMRVQYKLLRDGKKESTLNRFQLVQLFDIGFIFDSPHRSYKWEERIEQCQAFVKEHGHLRIKKDHPVLGKWCGHLRFAYKCHLEGKETTTALTPERIQQLDDLGFVWLAGKRMDKECYKNRKSWDERFQEFVEYLHTNGDPFVPQLYKGGLGLWVRYQRVQYRAMEKNLPARITQEKVQKLKDAGFEFDGWAKRKKGKDALHNHDEEGDDADETCDSEDFD